ncbi:serine/threonine protein kinase [Longispora albida]|uniref:serine/threonine protein kinase n=1 Tax=Longispora albida TaxID=203523 RepID=UPI0003730D82|nr:serine/threonine protein kinase [Longispora albida]
MFRELAGGRYRLDRRIAAGGMGEVWRGADTLLGRPVAVKLMHAGLTGQRGFRERFVTEARVMAALDHPGVVPVYDYGEERGTAYLVMEFVEGRTLGAVLDDEGTLPPDRVLDLVAQAAGALAAAHARGVVHRDVKPANLLVRPSGQLVLTDFGIARSEGGHRTTAGAVLGTASYMAPEQVDGDDLTPAADQYSLGVVAYRCLTGRVPFTGEGPAQIALQHVTAEPPPLPESVPVHVRSLVERAMAKDPGARFASAADLAAACRGEVVPEPPRARRSRRPYLVAAAVAVLGLAAAVSWYSVTPAPGQPAARSTAEAASTLPAVAAHAGPSAPAFAPGTSASPTPKASTPSPTPTPATGTSSAPAQANPAPQPSGAPQPAASQPVAPPPVSNQPVPQTVVVPNTIGMSSASAVSRLTADGFRVTQPNKCTNGVIQAQDPAGGTRVSPGSQVLIFCQEAQGQCPPGGQCPRAQYIVEGVRADGA